MQCVILAGGIGTRLRPLTETIPKALIPVAGRPFAAHQLCWLAGQGVSDVVYLIGHLGGAVREFVGDGRQWGLRVKYSEDGTELRGTAGAIRLAYDRRLLEPSFCVLYGDSYLSVPVQRTWERFCASNAAALMTVYRNEDQLDRSNARLHNGFVVHYEKGLSNPLAAGMHHIDYGFSILDRDAVVTRIEPDAPVDLAAIYQRLSAEGELAGFEVTERFYEIGSPTGLAELEALLSGAQR